MGNYFNIGSEIYELQRQLTSLIEDFQREFNNANNLLNSLKNNCRETNFCSKLEKLSSQVTTASQKSVSNLSSLKTFADHQIAAYGDSLNQFALSLEKAIQAYEEEKMKIDQLQNEIMLGTKMYQMYE